LSLLRYSTLVLAVATATFAIAWEGMLRRADAPVRGAVAFGAGLAVINTVAAHALVRWSSSRTGNAFLGVVLGGMVGRMAVMLAAVASGVLLMGLPKVPLAVSLLSYFLLFLFMELSILQRRTSEASPGGRAARQ